jgi:archaeosine synthase beta-subunit
MANLTKAIFAARDGFTPPDEDLTQYVKAWTEDEFLDGKPVKAKVLILRTRGCTWDYQHGCTMCGYFNDTAHRKVTAEQLIAQYQRLEPQLKDEQVLKIYTGGSFTDPAEVFPEAQDAILSAASRKVKKITVEARPEYCPTDRMKHIAQLVGANGCTFEVGIGLESSSDLVCHTAINKGYGFAEFVEAAKNCRAAGVKVKAYLLLKPPFLTEDETVEDIVQSIKDAAPYSDILSVNPTNVQKFTLVEKLFENREYRPPWLWSVVEVLRRGKPFAGQAILKSDPVGGGQRRGAHNCGRCDQELLKRIDQYNLSQDVAFVDAAAQVDCSCKKEYAAVRRLEGHLVGGMYL